jgi:hypothetical protein
MKKNYRDAEIIISSLLELRFCYWSGRLGLYCDRHLATEGMYKDQSIKNYEQQ